MKIVFGALEEDGLADVGGEELEAVQVPVHWHEAGRCPYKQNTMSSILEYRLKQ